jgi:hypothetical protein
MSDEVTQQAIPEPLEVNHARWSQAACGGHANRYCEDDDVWDATCFLCARNYQHLKERDDKIAALQAEVERLRERGEQTDVQLAGCLTAAEGWDDGKCKQGDYGWSVAFDAVCRLRAQLAAATAPVTNEEWRKRGYNAHYILRENVDALMAERGAQEGK